MVELDTTSQLDAEFGASWGRRSVSRAPHRGHRGTAVSPAPWGGSETTRQQLRQTTLRLDDEAVLVPCARDDRRSAALTRGFPIGLLSYQVVI
jgi:hypothetical protein